MLELGQIVDATRIFRRNTVNLRQIRLRNDRIVDMRQHLRRVRVQIRARLVVHDTLIQLARLVVLAELALVVVVGLARDDVVRDFVRRFRDFGRELVGEAVRRVLLAAGVVGVDAHGAVNVERTVGFGHEGAIDGNLVQVDTDAVVLGL